MGTSDAGIRFYAKPKPILPDRVLGETLTALLVAGIVNPFGPTLNAVVAMGKLKRGAKLPVVHLMLNPFSQEVHAVGELALGQQWRPAEAIRALFALPFGSCPSLVLPSTHLSEEQAVTLHAEFLCHHSDARDVLDRIKQFFGNPWDRVSHEMRIAAERQAGGYTDACPAPLTEVEAREFAQLLLSEQQVKPELQAFFYAWDGSIKRVAPGLPSMGLEPFLALFWEIAKSCRLPDLRDSSA